MGEKSLWVRNEFRMGKRNLTDKKRNEKRKMKKEPCRYMFSFYFFWWAKRCGETEFVCEKETRHDSANSGWGGEILHTATHWNTLVCCSVLRCVAVSLPPASLCRGERCKEEIATI